MAEFSKTPEEVEMPNWVSEIADAMTESDFDCYRNHEAYAGYLKQPKWVDMLETLYCGSWRMFPEEAKAYEPYTLGLRIGKEVGHAIAGAEWMMEDKEGGEAALRKLEDLIFQEVTEVKSDMTELLDSWDEMHIESIEAEKKKIARVLVTIWLQDFETIQNFMNGLGKGLASVGGMESLSSKFLSEEFSENERTTVARILRDNWPQVEQLPNFTKIADLVVESLPPERSEFLASNVNARKAFEDNLRKLGKAAGLVKSGRGRPKKK